MFPIFLGSVGILVVPYGSVTEAVSSKTQTQKEMLAKKMELSENNK